MVRVKMFEPPKDTESIGIERFQWYFTTFLELEQHQLRLLALAFSGDQVTWVLEIK